MPEELVTVVNVDWFGSDVVELTYKTATGKLGSELVYREQESQLEVAERGRPNCFSERKPRRNRTERESGIWKGVRAAIQAEDMNRDD